MAKRWVSNGQFGAFSLQYASAKVDGNIYLFGGRQGLGTGGRNTAYKYSENNGALVALANIPQTLVAMSAVAVGRLIYLFGGASQLSSGSESKKVYIYDIDANTWSTGTDCPVTSICPSTTAIGTDIYMYGGSSSTASETNYPKLFYKYDTVNKTWTVLPYHDGNPMLGTSCVTINGLLYAFGGEYNTSSFFDSDVRIFDPVANTWSKPTVTGTKPGGRGSGLMVKINASQFVYIGGRVTNGSTCTAEAWLFDTVKLTWTVLSTYPTGIAFQRGELVANSDIVVFDGYTGSSFVTTGYRLT